MTVMEFKAALWACQGRLDPATDRIVFPNPYLRRAFLRLTRPSPTSDTPRIPLGRPSHNPWIR